MTSLSPASPATVPSTQTSLIIYNKPKSIDSFIREQVEKFFKESPVRSIHSFQALPSIRSSIDSSMSATYRLNRHDTWNTRVPPRVREEIGQFKIASLNIQTKWITDSQANLEKFPKYAWEKRLRPITQLILMDNPLILALSELHIQQAEDIIHNLKGLGYQLIGYSSETQEPMEAVIKKVAIDKDYYYSEIVGLLFNSTKVALKNCECIELERGERHRRILVIAHFIHIASKVHFAVLTTHFDHLSLVSRQKSGEKELTIISDLENRGIPWFSIGDRNWFSNIGGQECAEAYIRYPHICDFRDENIEGHYGPSGTYPGHLGLPKHFEPRTFQKTTGEIVIEAQTLDVGFRSRRGIEGINDYTYSGEFSPETHDLIPFDRQGHVLEKNFISDHYYIGGTFCFTKKETPIPEHL